MVSAVFFGHFMALATQGLFKEGIDYELLPDRVPGNLPGQLVRPTSLRVDIPRGLLILVPIGFDLGLAVNKGWYDSVGPRTYLPVILLDSSKKGSSIGGSGHVCEEVFGRIGCGRGSK
jgi:hypothetical protein